MNYEKRIKAKGIKKITIRECSDNHIKRPCTRELYAQPLCEGCSKRVIRSGIDLTPLFQ